MKCDELEIKYVGYGMGFYPTEEVDAAIAELKAENDRLKNEKKKMYTKLQHDTIIDAMSRSHLKKLRATKRALWLMTAEWAEAMGLASCNIANKFMSRENFEVGDDYRNNTVKKYRHRQVVFYKYADYCRKKAEEYK